MKIIANTQHGSLSNHPTDGDAFTKMLEAMTVDELTDGLTEALESITAENYDPALIDAYLAALDRKAPLPEVPDAKTAFSDFQKRVSQAFPTQKNLPTFSRRRPQRFVRAGLVAAFTMVVLMSGMVVAQAAGLDVFGAMARWTDEVFSLGVIRSDGANDGTSAPVLADNDTNNYRNDYTSLQEALDDYSITEFCEPTWLPDGYVFEKVEVESWLANGSLIGLYATYYDGSNFLQIRIEYYDGNANVQVEKTNAPVESFTVDGQTVYLLENINSNSAAWATEHYECYISGKVEKQVLKEIVLSAYAK